MRGEVDEGTVSATGVDVLRVLEGKIGEHVD